MDTRVVSIDERPSRLIAFLVVVGVYFAVGHWADTAAASESESVRDVVEGLWFLGLAGLGAVFLRVDGASATDVGLSRRFLLPGVGAFIAVWVALNAVGVGIATASGNPWGLGLLQQTGVGSLLVVLYLAFVEEFVFRGYLQVKVRSVLGADSVGSRTVAIGVAGVLFALAHVPRILAEGGYVNGTSVVGTLLVLTLSGVGFGVVYELTENLYFVGFLHAFGNSWPLLVDGFAWDGRAQTAFFVAVGVVYLGVTGLYRRLAAGTLVTPRVRVDGAPE